MTRNPLRRAASSRLAPLALVLAALLCGCSNNANVLAKVNGEPITVDEFNEVGRSSFQQYAGPPDSAKARLLNDLIDRELMVQGALREGAPETPELKLQRELIERQTLREAIFQKLMGGPFQVSDAEIDEHYQRAGTATRTRLIFSFAEAQARQAAKDLERGDDFATVADRYNPPGMIPPGGDIGFVQPGSLLPPLDDLVRTGELKRVHGPVSGGGDGWFVVRLEERKTQPMPPLAEIKDQLTEMLRQRKQRVAGMKVVETLRKDHDVKVVSGAPQVAMEKFRTAPATAPGAAPESPTPPTAEERKQVLATYREGTYTLGEAFDDLRNATGNRPNLSMLPTVERWIESQTLERAALAEARKRRLADEPEIKNRLRERQNNLLLDGYYQRHVAARIQAGPGDIEAAYERHKTSFSRLATARVVTVTMRDSAGAAALAGQAGNAPSLREAAATAAAGGRVREERLKFPATTPLWTQLESRLMSMNPGDIGGPFPAGGGWLIVQLIEKQQDAPPLASLPPGAQMQIQGAASEMKREARLAALTDSLRQAFKPELHPERLAKLPWPPPPATPGT